MTESSVIYEVTLDADGGIREQFDAWLTKHVREMLQLPGFVAAKVLQPETQEIPADRDAPIRRVVQYTLADRSALDNYLQEHAAGMRAEGVKLFGERVRSSRQILAVRAAQSAHAAKNLPVAATSEPTALHCLNCGALLTGKFCANCGQQNHTYAAPLWGVINDFFGNHFGFDTKFFHSILPLLFRPGFLTREYSAGRRARYINPLRLYFFSSLLFFFVAWSFASPQFMHFNDLSSNAKSRSALSQAERKKIENNQYLTAQQKKTILDSGRQPASAGASQASSSDNKLDFTMFGRPVSMSKSEFTGRFTHALEVSLPKLMFVFLPLVALLLKLFYIRSKRFYMEHLVFTLHNHAFMFLAMLLMVLDNVLAKHVAWAAAPVHYFNVIIGWYMVIYIFIAMRVYYRQSYIKTFIKYLLIGFIYWLIMLSTFIAGMVLIVFEVASA